MIEDDGYLREEHIGSSFDDFLEEEDECLMPGPYIGLGVSQRDYAGD